MKSAQIKQWLGQKAILVLFSLIFLSLLLYATAYFLEKGFTSFSPGTAVAAIATAILLAAFSASIEQYMKAKLTDNDVNSMLKCRELGIFQIQERDVEKGFFSGLPEGILEECRDEFVVLAYAADNFIERKRRWIKTCLSQGLRISIIILDSNNLDQARQTEGHDIEPQTRKTLNYCNEFFEKNIPGIENFTVKAYSGHLYYTGIFLDRRISYSKTESGRGKKGKVCIQLKANYKSQHEGIVLSFAHDSRYAAYYTESCRSIWLNSTTLLGTENSQC